ncbi:MAG: virB8 family protein [Inquilinus sp.]|uniref:virB8 family protein n=1 Tax=Inquilinus sp. TaxID=1932117 RepID=UPI003F30AA58
MTVTDDAANLFASARRYDDDRLRWLRAGKTTWMLCALAGWGTAAILAGAIYGLTPLKTTELRVVRVDQTTGAVDLLSQADGVGSVAHDEPVIRYFLNAYVVARETYSPSDREQLFDQAAVLSTPEEQQRWAAYYNESPASPQIVLGRNGSATVEVRSISFYSDSIATVRFVRNERVDNRTTENAYVATITFGFSDEAMAQSMMLKNPLGFLVSEYRRDNEVVK